MVETLLQRMDATVFLGFDVWEFSARSLFQRYGRLFLGAVMLRHPWRTWLGLRAYRRCVRPARQSHLAPLHAGSDPAWPQALAEGDWLVGLGFCQKPPDPVCPAGRPNHRCILLTQLDRVTPPLACRACQIREVAVRALPAGATVHIMTSAADIAHDLLLPALRGGPLNRVALSLCPYSVAPLSLAFTICGCRGWILPYERGNCLDYPAWLKADEGIKPEQTFLPDNSHRRLLTLLDQVAALRTAKGRTSPGHFQEMGNLYVPAY